MTEQKSFDLTKSAERLAYEMEVAGKCGVEVAITDTWGIAVRMTGLPVEFTLTPKGAEVLRDCLTTAIEERKRLLAEKGVSNG